MALGFATPSIVRSSNYSLGVVLYELDGAARDDFERTIVLAPHRPEAYSYLASLAASSTSERSHDPEKAMTYARKACELSKWRSWRAMEAIAIAYAGNGRFPEAAAAQSIALRMSPADFQSRSQTRLAQLNRAELPTDE